MTYKLKGVGIDANSYLLSIGLSDPVDIYHCDLDDTEGIRYLSKIEIPDTSTIICKTYFSENLEEHLLIFNKRVKKSPDILLLSTSILLNEDNELLQIHQKYPTLEFGVFIEDKYSKENLEQIVSIIENSTGCNINFFGLNLNPINFNYEVLEWIGKYDSNADIIGYEALGSKYMKNYLLSAFTRPYLLEFAAFYCTGLIIEHEDIIYTSSLVNTEVVDPLIFKLESTIYREYPKLNKMISSKVNFFDNCNLVLEDFNILPLPSNITYSFYRSLAKNEYADSDPDLLEIIKGVDCSIGGAYNLIYDKFLTYLENLVSDKKKYSDEIDVIKISKTVSIFSIKEKRLEKKYFIAPNKYKLYTVNYFLGISNEGNVIIKKIN